MLLKYKAYKGTITGTPTGPWHYKNENHRGVIKAGKENGEPRTNPQQQVTDYAWRIRSKLIEFNRYHQRQHFLASAVETSTWTQVSALLTQKLILIDFSARTTLLGTKLKS